MLNPLYAALEKVDRFTYDNVIANPGFDPIPKTFKEETGEFISYNTNDHTYSAMWVRDGQMLSTTPAIMDKNFDTVVARQHEATAHGQLRPIGLVKLEDDHAVDNDTLPPLERELGKVDLFTINALFTNKGLEPVGESYDQTTGAFVVFNPKYSAAVGYWVRDGKLLSTDPAIIAGDVNTVIARQKVTGEDTLVRVGLMPVDEMPNSN